jgi:hypothetical protein
MAVNLKAAPVYKPAPLKLVGPPVYRPQQTGSRIQSKPAGSSGLEIRPSPPVYRANSISQQILSATERGKVGSIRPANSSNAILRPRYQIGSSLLQCASNNNNLVKQTSENTCWAAAFAVVLGVQEASIQVEWELGSSIRGLSYDATKPLAAKLGLTVHRKWADTIKFPVAVALPNHWVVVTNYGMNKSKTRNVVEYFDPATNKTLTVSPKEFDDLRPTIGVSQ